MNWLKNFDSFAKTVQFTFKGRSKYSTKVGGVVSLICYALFSTVFLMKTIALIGKFDPDLFMIESESNYAGLDLYELGFMFAIEKFDKRIGRIETTLDKWEIDGSWSSSEIDMVDCTTLIRKFEFCLIFLKF